MFNFDLVAILQEMQTKEMKIVKLFTKELKVYCSHIMAKCGKLTIPWIKDSLSTQNIDLISK